ncbi:MAG: hypothetical protein Q8P13_04810 [bacterium]|nr:hypothetical protein [bacterium]
MKILPLLESRNGFGVLLSLALFLSALITSLLALNTRSIYSLAAAETPLAACYISPTPSSVGEDFNIFGSGLPSSSPLSLKMSESGNQTFLSSLTNPSGELAATWHSNFGGTAIIYIYDSSGTLLTSCSFEVL